MYRPGGFPEYTPAEQRIFDTVVSILTKHFEKWNYQHIMTPAVEPVDILTRGDIGDKQVYGLYGLAQGNEDVKDYALHFDLTVPFARYVLDHMNDLAFPFKRYQMQPVRRGERTKRGRYKEFWQFDIDTIWRSENNVGVWYDAESIIVEYQALHEIFTTCGVPQNIIVKFSNIGITKRYLSSLGIEGDNQLSVCKLLDDYFKMTHEAFTTKLSTYVDTAQSAAIEKILTTHDHTLLSGIEGYENLDTVVKYLKQFGVNAQFDFAIIRGHAYYTSTVVEFFLENDMELGAIAGGGAYHNFTDFINPKHSFSGVGCSLSSRIMEVLLSLGGSLPAQTSYMFVNFPEMQPETLDLVQKFHAGGLKAEIYPTTVKIQKQLEYAARKGITYAIMYGEGEKKEGVFKQKNLETGEEITYALHYAAGGILFHDKKVLLIKNHNGWRGFPKGHYEGNETVDETILREIQEETGITKLAPLSNETFVHTYFFDTGHVWKTNLYKAYSVESSEVALQAEELEEYKRCTYDEAMNLLVTSTQIVLKQVPELFK